jgi:hypothetical protein
VVTGEELMSRFVGLETSRQACIDEEVARDKAKLQGFTQVLDVAPDVGDENRPMTRFR